MAFPDRLRLTNISSHNQLGGVFVTYHVQDFMPVRRYAIGQIKASNVRM